jgi:hypothetical protein
VGSITFKKKSKEAVNLNRLYLRWKGSVLPHLMGSLYRKMPDRDFLPIEEHLVCDGTWNKAQQTLRLTFDHKESLGLTNVFYLVLTVPSDLELAVRRGRFDLEPQVLPEQFRTATSHQNLSLTLDALDATID